MKTFKQHMLEEGSKQITANPNNIKSLLKKHKIKVTRKEKDLFLPKGHMDITLDGDDENLKAFLDDFKRM